MLFRSPEKLHHFVFGLYQVARAFVSPPNRYYNTPTIGVARRAYWGDGDRGYRWLQAIKQQWDPGNLLRVYQGVSTDRTIDARE